MIPRGRFLVGLALVLSQPAQIELHLALVFRLETALLQFHHDQPPEFAVVEPKVDVKVVAVELDALLPGDEGKARAQLQPGNGSSSRRMASFRSRSTKRSVSARKSKT
jgi:hypothetical protein